MRSDINFMQNRKKMTNQAGGNQMKRLRLGLIGLLCLLCCACQKNEAPVQTGAPEINAEADAFLRGENKEFMEKFHE